jgi:hypothetical protein
MKKTAGIAYSLSPDQSDFSAASHQPANYRGSYTTGSREIEDTEVSMCQGAGKIITTAESSWSWSPYNVLLKV